MSETTEILDSINRDDEVVSCHPREVIYAQKLPHRIVHVVIKTPDGRLVIQKRSLSKSFCPGHWSTAVGGHVLSGETPEEAAYREYQEELGANSPLRFLGRYYYADKTLHGLWKYLYIFETISSQTFAPNPAEVERVEYFTLAELGRMLKLNEPFHPELRFLLREHYQL